MSSTIPGPRVGSDCRKFHVKLFIELGGITNFFEIKKVSGPIVKTKYFTESSGLRFRILYDPLA